MYLMGQNCSLLENYQSTGREFQAEGRGGGAKAPRGGHAQYSQCGQCGCSEQWGEREWRGTERWQIM